MQKGLPFAMNVIYCALFAAGVLIVLIKGRNIRDLGFGKEKLKTDLILSLAVIVITFLVIWKVSGLPFQKSFGQMLYYLFYIAAIEEILFRGFIQNYLFGFKLNRYVLFVIGALLFSFMHIPFQMFAHNDVSWHYLVKAVPNLIETFIAHLVWCFIADKRGNITVPIALHYAYDFLGVIL